MDAVSALPFFFFFFLKKKNQKNSAGSRPGCAPSAVLVPVLQLARMRKDTTIIRPRCNATVSYIILIPRKKWLPSIQKPLRSTAKTDPSTRAVPQCFLSRVGAVSFERCRAPPVLAMGDVVGCESPTWVGYLISVHMLRPSPQTPLQQHDSTCPRASDMG